eukprot:gnl/Spiro4/12033_TR6347_c0_g1_i1.p2 gnl/Spiro4/12033_TR6347_c0_g1~~gnl/Spiro4/12033_TR6347_c0_g1_i1.p2  ORF type:complete len:147 (+),score=38.16 gnl/Spiro4/12033_TR6347_c0_g1_i1:39-443(+)
MTGPVGRWVTKEKLFFNKRNIALVASRVWGTTVGTVDCERSGRRWLKKKLIGPSMVRYYPTLKYDVNKITKWDDIREMKEGFLTPNPLDDNPQNTKRILYRHTDQETEMRFFKRMQKVSEGEGTSKKNIKKKKK